MKSEILNLIQEACSDQEKFKSLENIYTIYEDLQMSETIQEMFEVIYRWLEQKYNINKVNFYLFNIQENIQTPMLKKGSEYALDDPYAFFVIINTHTQLNAVVSFCANNQNDFEYISKYYDYIQMALFQLSPILQTGIMKKQYLEYTSVDIVTNVHNKKFLIDYINKKQQLAHHEVENVTFLMIGIDRFKAIIDEFDYSIGDMVLVELAKVIHNNISEHDIIARLEGDEFVVALTDPSSIMLSEKIAKDIIEQFSQVKIVIDKQKDHYLKKTICVGISHYPKDNEDINMVLKNADSCLYEAKNLGRGKYLVYSEEDIDTIDLF
jgi:diguanylate cyclase (GGDEF)-like protein